MEIRGQIHTSLLYPQGNNPSTYWTGGYMGSRAILNVLKKEKFLAPAGIRTQIVQSVSQLLYQMHYPSFPIQFEFAFIYILWIQNRLTPAYRTSQQHIHTTAAGTTQLA
jgi:hypothetical protein